MKDDSEFMISIKNLSFSFNKELILNNLNLSVTKGAIYGFIGPNGAGKTTTIKLLLGLLPKGNSDIKLFGKTLTQDRQHYLTKIGSLIEQPSLYEHLSGYDNLSITANIRNYDHKRIIEVLELVNLSADSQKAVSEYSLGMKQRLGLALALLGEPELLILDEPVNGLDPIGIIETRELLLHLNRQFGVTIFLSSHLLPEIERIVTHIGILNKGEMIFEGTIDELRAMNRTEIAIRIKTDNNEIAKNILRGEFVLSQDHQGFIIIPFKNHKQVSGIARLLLENSLEIHHIDVRAKDLEKTFIDLTENKHEII